MSDAEKKSQGLLAIIRCTFTCADLPDVRWHVRRFTLTEALSEPYQLTLEVITDAADVDVKKLLGSLVALHVERGGGGRAVHGVVKHVSELGVVVERTSFLLIVVPVLALRGQVTNTRFFQEKSVPEIVTEVLEAPLEHFGRKLRQHVDSAAYQKREYCVQFRESDLDFVSRLLQEEGIVYSFEHPQDGDGEVLVLTDDTKLCAALEFADGDKVQYVAKDSGAVNRQSVENLTPTHDLRSTAVAHRDYDWKAPSEPFYDHDRRTPDARFGERELYEHNHRRLFSDDGHKKIRLKLERLTALTQQFHGKSDVVELVPGRTFKLFGHPQQAVDGEHLLVRVTHRGDMPEEDMYATRQQGSQARYTNEFECIRRDVPWRPEPTHVRPLTPGMQTAIVVGPDSEEVHTDEYGRIKVHFHWDRLSPNDDTASCWIRVAQRWAGPGWGSMIIPRVGMEVIVEFLDGDPDRPIVTGCLYNGRNAPPYPLPDEKTKSTIKSDSSPGGGGFNELRFEDAKGAEEIYIHAQLDMKTEVVRDDAGSAGRHQNHSVGVDRTASVGNNESTSIGVNQTLSVGSNQDTTVGSNQTLKVGADQTTTIGSNQTLTVGSNQTATIGSNQTLTVGSNQDATIGSNQTLAVGSNQTANIGADQTTNVGANQTLAVGASQTINVGAAATTSIGAAYTLNVGAARTTGVGAGDTLTVAGALAITAASITLTAGGSVVEIGPGGVTITTGALVNVTGATVNINS